MSPRIGSLFSGYGGLDMGVTAAIGGSVAWHVEYDKAPSKILAHHWPDVPNYGDVTKVDWSAVTPVEIVTAGFPCQDVSTAGPRAGLKRGTRTGLWHEVVKAIRALRPALVFLENVGGLLSARGDEPTDELERAWASRDAADRLIKWLDNEHAIATHKGDAARAQRITTRRFRLLGLRKRAVARAKRADALIARAIATVLGTLASLGFDADWICLRAADVGAPHGRLRIFILAWDAAVQHAGPFAISRSGGSVGGGIQSKTRGSGSAALLPTPRTSDTNGAGQHGDGGLDLRTAVSLLPTPAVNDMGEGKTVEAWDEWTTKMQAAHGNGNGHGKSLAIEAQRNAADYKSGWGIYTDAIARWEALTRPAPAPTQPSKKGTPQLSPAFSEWMMGLPAGHVTDVPGLSRNDMLKALGNGVVPQQAAAALRFLFSVQAVAA